MFQTAVNSLGSLEVAGYAAALKIKGVFICPFDAISRTNTDNYIQKEIELAQQYFNNHYTENLNIEEYASSRGMSISWFIRNYKSYTGTTPLQYILDRRIANAQILLESTDYSINEISNIVGYDNQLYFSRLFAKQKGISPKKYRELMK